MQKDERRHITGQAEEFGNHHEPVPRLDGQRHHEQLGEDERREGDGHDVDELRLEEQQRPVHDDAACEAQQVHCYSQIKYDFLCWQKKILNVERG